MKWEQLLICDDDWGRMRRKALQLASQGIPSLLVVKVKPSPELRELIRMIPPHPLIQQRFLPRKLFRILLPFRLAGLLLTRRIGRVQVDRERTLRSVAPWLQPLGIRCDMA